MAENELVSLQALSHPLFIVERALTTSPGFPTPKQLFSNTLVTLTRPSQLGVQVLT